MATFTVHEPPPRKSEETASPVRFAFVRDGFHFWAFVLGPLWMLWHRLWLELLLYRGGRSAAGAGLRMCAARRFGGAAQFAVGVADRAPGRLRGGERCGAGRSRAAAGRNCRRRGRADDLRGTPSIASSMRWSERTTAGFAARPAARRRPAITVPPSAAGQMIGLFPQPGGWR